MTSIYDREEVLFQCSNCGEQFAKPVRELRTKVNINCSACGTAVPVGNLTELVLDAVTKKLNSKTDAPDSSYNE